MDRVVARGRLAALLLISLLSPGAAAAAGAEREAADPPARAVAEARLLTDGDYVKALLSAIDRARKEIFLSAYLFRTIADARGYPEAVLSRLIAAAGRGVRVEVVLERNQEADPLSRSNAETAARLRKGGIRVCLEAPDRITHTKLVVIDRRYVLIGSHNLTQSALGYNHEASVWIDSERLAEEALRYLYALCPGRGP
jgi:phosphatidylserine/phosphatidylglycerophosphate/cardiolipin synthase-like enzyme